jgi:hypothetical protein
LSEGFTARIRSIVEPRTKLIFLRILLAKNDEIILFSKISHSQNTWERVFYLLLSAIGFDQSFT